MEYPPKIYFTSKADLKLGELVHHCMEEWNDSMAFIFDAVVAIMCEPSFNREELTMRSIVEFCAHASSERTRAILQKADLSLSTEARPLALDPMFLQVTQVSGMPPLVLSCVADVLEEIFISAFLASREEEWSMGHAPNDRPKMNVRCLNSAFLPLRLVHSTWYANMRRVFGKEVTIRRCYFYTEHAIFKELSMAFSGAWTQSLPMDCIPDRLDRHIIALASSFISKAMDSHGLRFLTLRISWAELYEDLHPLFDAANHLLGLESLSILNDYPFYEDKMDDYKDIINMVHQPVSPLLICGGSTSYILPIPVIHAASSFRVMLQTCFPT